MKKISLVLIFMLLISCIGPYTFAEAQEITVNFSGDFEKSPGVDVLMESTTPSGKTEGAEYIIFPVSLPDSGEYDIYITAASISDAGGSVKVQLSPEGAESVAIAKTDSTLEDISSYTKTYAKTEILSAGDHTVRITNENGSINGVRSVSFIKKSDKEAYRLYAPVVTEGGAVPSGGNVTVSGTYAWCWEYGTDFVGGTTLTFKMNAQTSGKYNMYMSAGSDGADFEVRINGNTVYSGNWQSVNHSTFKKELLANVVIPSGESTVEIICLGSDAIVLYLNHLDFVLTDSELAVSEIMAENIDLMTEDTANVSTDVLKVKFSDDVKASNITSENIKLYADGEEIPLIITAADDMVTAALTKTLVENANCTLIIKNIYDKDNVLSTGEKEYTFTVGDAYSNNASLVLNSSSLTDEVITAAGVVKSSADALIAGRKVMLYNAGEENTVLAEAVSEADGSFTVNYTLPQNTEAGMLNFVLKTQYSDALVPFSALYVTEEAENAFLSSLKETAAVADVKALFELNEAILSIDISADTEGISADGTDSVFEGFIGAEASLIGEVRERYYKRLAMIKMTEAADASEIDVLLADENICDALKIDVEKLSDISANRSSFINDVLRVDAFDDEQEYIDSLSELLNGYALAKYGKTNLDILAENKSTYIGSDCKLEISADGNLSEVKKVVLYISCDNNDILSNASFTASNGVATVSSTENGLKIEITPNMPELSEIGTLRFSSDISGNFTLTVTGEVIYDKNISYDLSSKLNEKSVAVFVSSELPPETTVDFESDFDVAEGVEIIMGDTTPAAIISGGGYVRFPITVPASGKYEIYVTAMSNSETGGKFKVQTSLEDVTATEIPKVSGELTNIDLYDRYLARTEYLSKGTHIVKITNVSGSTAVRSVTALKTEDKETYRMYAKSALNMDVPGVTVSGTYAAYYDDGTDIVGGTSVNFDLNVESQGFYELYVTAASGMGANITATVNDEKSISSFIKTPQHIILKKELLGVFGIPAGKTTVSVTCVGPDSDVVLINSIDLVLKSKTLDVESVVAENVNLAESSAPVSTDTITVTLGANVDLNTASAEQIKLTCGNEEIPLMITAENNVITAALTKSLTAGSTYTLTLNGIYDEDNIIAITPYELSFEVGDTYSENAAVTVTESSMRNEYLTVTGVVKSSAGLGISGRKVMLFKTDSPDIKLAEAVSGADGLYTINYTMPQGSQSGMHNFIVKTEYSQEDAAFSQIYVTAQQETAFLTALASTETENDVLTLLEANEDILSVDVSEDVHGISEEGKSLMLSGLAGAEIASISDVRAKYYSRIAMVKISETSDAQSASALLSDSDLCESLGLNENKLSDIAESIEAFADELNEIPAQTDEQKYIELAKKLLDRYVLDKYSKANTDIIAASKDIYVGQVAVIDVSSKEKLNEVEKIVLTISSEKDSIISGAEFVTEEGINASVEKTDNLMTVTLKASSGEFEKLGTLKLSGNPAGAYSIKVSGCVTYDKELDYVLTSELNEKIISLSVTKNTNKDYGSSSGGGGGGGTLSGNLGSIAVPETTEKFEFKDLENAAWAEEAIIYLLNNGIVSESDDKNFRPNDSVTREEFVKMIVVALGIYDGSSTSGLSDVNEGSWYYPYIASAEKTGLICGNDKGKFGVGNNITREDIAVIITRALIMVGFSDDGIYEGTFADDEQISGYAKGAVYYMKKLGLINGVGENKFAPKETATRAMAAKMIFEMMKAVGK